MRSGLIKKTFYTKAENRLDYSDSACRKYIKDAQPNGISLVRTAKDCSHLEVDGSEQAAT